MLIIGLTGPAGAGKDISAEYISRKLSVEHHSGGDVIRTMLTGLNLPVIKTAVVAFGNFLRENYGTDYIASRAVGIEEDKKGVVYSGFRSPSEAQYVKDHGGFIVYIDAPTEVRHERILDRRRSDDTNDQEKLNQIDQKELQAQDDAGENLEKVKALADFTVINDSDLDSLHKKLDEITEKLIAKTAA
jgi:dephospho-CoA kinase